MKIRSAQMLAALVLPASIACAQSPTLPVDPESLPKVSCTEFRYSAQFLHLYPKAPAACVEGRLDKGVKYAKFNARVYLASPDFITVELLNVAGDSLSTFSFKPSPSAEAVVNGTTEKLSEVKPGDKISFWVTEAGLNARSMPAPTKETWRVLPPKS